MRPLFLARQNKRLQPAASALVLMTAATLICLSQQQPSQAKAPALIAHQVETAKDIGATLHIEPGDTPRAGEDVLAWFALTRPGGETIPLSACRCELAIYDKTAYEKSGTEAAPSLEAPLSAVEAEGYQGIPGATFAFPVVGAYTLVLAGSPTDASSFEPFELDFDVTVAAGKAIPQVPENEAAALPAPPESANEPTAETTDQPASTSLPTRSLVGLGGTILLVGLAWAIRRTQQKP